MFQNVCVLILLFLSSFSDDPVAALQRAKYNVETHYSIVGISEDILSFFEGTYMHRQHQSL